MDIFLGEIRLFGCGFAPLGWHDCDGSLLSISANEALFNLLGTTYGGDGQASFGVPDMRGRLPVHQGSSRTGISYFLGQMSGTESVTLTPATTPQHTHTVFATSSTANVSTPGPTVELGAISGDSLYTGSTANVPTFTIGASMISPAGGSQAHENTMPTLALRFCIATQGIYPSPN